jgi:short-subunit dehydrogenase
MKKAIIIGATSGIGEGLAKILTKNNYKVGITGRRTELLEALKAQKSNDYFISSFDISNTQIIDEKLKTLVSKLGGLDLLILSSGTGDLNETLDFSIEKRTIDTNILGFTYVADWA